MNPTPLERFRASGYLAGLFSTGISVVVLFLCIIGGVALRIFNYFSIHYPFLDWNQDPLVWFLIAGVGRFVSIAMVGRIFGVLLAPESDDDKIRLVLLGQSSSGSGCRLSTTL